MDDRDKIAYLQELATSHFNDGNFAAAVSAWKQVLAVDPAHAEARKGIQLAERKMEVQADMRAHEASVADDDGAPFDMGETVVVGATGGEPFNPDATMMVSGAAPFAPPRPPETDTDKTMVFSAPPMPGAPAKSGPPPASGASFDAEKTMMFAPPARPAAPPPASSGGFDADKTMVFGSPGAMPTAPKVPPPSAAPGGFDADRTVTFQPGLIPPPPPKAPAEGGFDAEKTMMFAPPPAAAPPAPENDADRTMVFSASPLGAAPWNVPSTPAAAEAESDKTMMSEEGWDLGAALPGVKPPAALPPAAPPAPPRVAAPPPPAAPPPAAKGALEDFELPSGGLGLGGAPGALDFGLPPASPSAKAPGSAKPEGGSFGFSFELPPAVQGGAGVPDLPSVGLPPAPPKAPAGTPKSTAPKAASVVPPPPPKPAVTSKFGEANAAESAGLEVPTLGFAEATAGDKDIDRERIERERKEQEQRDADMKARYAQEFGKTPVGGAAPASAGRAAAPKGRLLPWFVLIGVIGVLGGAGYVAVEMLTPEAPPVVDAEPPPPPVVEKPLDPAEAQAQMRAALEAADVATRAGDVKKAHAELARYDEISAKAGVGLPEHEAVRLGVKSEQDYQEKSVLALQAFCKEDYGGAWRLYQELEKARPDDPVPDAYIARIFFNAAVQQLQGRAPAEAVWYFDQVLARVPKDAEAAELRAFAARFKPSDRLEESYLSRVDRVEPRMAGCK